MWANNTLLFFLSDPFSSVPKESCDPKGTEETGSFLAQKSQATMHQS